MEKQEFNLSEKIQNQLIYICALRYDKDCNAERFAEATDKIEEDIKEFIKRLKTGTKLRQMIEGHSATDFIFNNFIKDIDKLT